MRKIAILGLIVALCVIATAGVAVAASVAPILVQGNPTCEERGYAAGYKIDPPNPGTYSFGEAPLHSIPMVRTSIGLPLLVSMLSYPKVGRMPTCTSMTLPQNLMGIRGFIVP